MNQEFLKLIALLSCVLVISVSGEEPTKETIAVEFKKHEIIPDVIDSPPSESAQVTYGTSEAKFGNVLTPTQVKAQPIVKWTLADPTKFYTLIMTDPDAPSRKDPKVREWHHWLVGNIPGDQVEKGEVLSSFVGSGPPKDSGLHRYIFLIFEQPEKLKFDEKKLVSTSGENRARFSTRKFAQKYKLGKPVAGNFFQSEYDSYVDILIASLG